MIYLTGDKHGDFIELAYWSKREKWTKKDVVIILGDSGINYNQYHEMSKEFLLDPLSEIKPTVFCIHGNHEERAENVEYPGIHEKFYTESVWNGGKVYSSPLLPNVKFAVDGEVYEIEGKKFLVLGGAYSVDKHWRLEAGSKWFESEQIPEWRRAEIIEDIKDNIKTVDVVLSHTCPYKYIPTEWFIPGLDQSTVDQSMERWLDDVEERLGYKQWYCGHFHGYKHIDKITFLFNGVSKLRLL